MKVITIGRSEDNDKVVYDPYASGHHLQIIQHDDGHFSLSDFGSTNGTFVNGRKISGNVVLNDMDIVRIGNTTIPWRMYFDEVDDSGYRMQPNEEVFPNSAVQGDSPSTPVRKEGVNEKERHGFVTFWLGLCMIGSIGSIISSFNSTSEIMSKVDELKRQFTAAGIDATQFSETINTHLYILLLSSVGFGITLLVFYVMLLRYKKIGFWGVMGTQVVSGIVSAVMITLMEQDFSMIGVLVKMKPLMSLCMAAVSVLILWGVLQIKKNGISCWKLLE